MINLADRHAAAVLRITLHGRRRLVEPGGHRSAADARGRGGSRLISPRIYQLSAGTAEKNLRKTATRRMPARGHVSVATRGDPSALPRYDAHRGNATRDRDERRRGLPSRRPADFSWTRARRFYSAHGKQFCPIINRAIVGGWLYARGAFHTSECNGNQIERRRARGPSAGVNTR